MHGMVAGNNGDVMSLDPLRSLVRNRTLIWQLGKRDIAGRYRGSVFGMFWSLFNPLLMLAVYTLVFGVVLRVRWSSRMPDGGEVDFSVILFSGLIIHTLFSECFTRAPTLVTSNPNFVKRIVFPLEVLPYIALISALFHGAISFLVLIAAHLVLAKTMAWTIILTPIVLLPLLPMILGLTWFLAALGVFLRDVGQITAVISTVLLFVGPIFFPIDKLPAAFQSLVVFNPLSVIVIEFRKVALYGVMPDWGALALYTLVSLVVAQLGFLWFKHTRRGFADVL